jgi:hypothetical protein
LSTKDAVWFSFVDNFLQILLFYRLKQFHPMFWAGIFPPTSYLLYSYLIVNIYDMDNKVEVKNLLDQLKDVQALSESPRTPETKLEKEQVEDFVIQQSSRLIKETNELILSMKDYIAHSPESKEILAISELIKASTAAIDTLNKINLAEKKDKTAKEIKLLDIASKKELKNTENENRVTFTREEILKQLMQSSIGIESVTKDAKKPE